MAHPRANPPRGVDSGSAVTSVEATRERMAKLLGRVASAAGLTPSTGDGEAEREAHYVQRQRQFAKLVSSQQQHKSGPASRPSSRPPPPAAPSPPPPTSVFKLLPATTTTPMATPSILSSARPSTASLGSAPRRRSTADGFYRKQVEWKRRHAEALESQRAQLEREEQRALAEERRRAAQALHIHNLQYTPLSLRGQGGGAVRGRVMAGPNYGEILSSLDRVRNILGRSGSHSRPPVPAPHRPFN